VSLSGSFTPLSSFGGNNGSYPVAGLVQASDGNFYGTTYSGGSDPEGTLFTVTASGVLTTLYSFAGGSDGAHPAAILIQASDGELYGTTDDGGAHHNAGTLFKYKLTGSLTTLVDFGTRDAEAPWSALIQATDGSLYGTTNSGGAYGGGAVFKIDPDGVFSILQSFNTTEYPFTTNSGGAIPAAALIQASDGNLYGTTEEGGVYGGGTVFRITTSGRFTTLYNFGGIYGISPEASLIQASDSNLYGTTYMGGVNGYGTVFRITTAGVFTTLYSFIGWRPLRDDQPVWRWQSGRYISDHAFRHTHHALLVHRKRRRRSTCCSSHAGE
jgi:uncharacterized repeat protein (TIGR03803 family)